MSSTIAAETSLFELPPRPHALDRFSWLGLVILLAIFLATAIRFMGQQSLWVDETTQLRGIELGPVRVVSWLAGAPIKLDVPPDRTPPIGYWMGWGWSQLFGRSEMSLRSMGLTCALAAILVTYATARRAFGPAAALAAAAYLALSANVVMTAVDIRAYPIFLLFASCACYCYVGWLTRPPAASTRWLAAMSACMVLSIFTHFFGVVFSASLSLAVLVSAVTTRRRLVAPFVACAIAGVASAGLLPFILASTQISNTSVHRDAVRDAARLAYRLFANPAVALHPIAVAGAAAGFCVVLFLAVFRPGSARTIRTGAAVAFLGGFAAVAAASLVIHGFETTAPHYNIWMLPVVALLIAGAWTIDGPRARRVVAVATVVLLASASVGIAELAFRGAYFVHGPERNMMTIIDALPPDGNVAVLYDDDGTHAQTMFAVQYAKNGAIHQYAAQPDGSVQPLTPGDQTSAASADLPYHYLLVVRNQQTSASDLTRLIRAGGRSPEDPPVLGTLLASGKWRCLSRHVYPAFVTADVAVLERNP